VLVAFMRFGVLGPLAVWTTAGELVAIPGLKVRARWRICCCMRGGRCRLTG
jgi:hypothetical protein